MQRWIHWLATGASRIAGCVCRRYGAGGARGSAHIYGGSHTYPNRHYYRYVDSHALTHCNCCALTNTDDYGYPHAYRDCHAHSYAYAYCHTYPHAYLYTTPTPDPRHATDLAALTAIYRSTNGAYWTNNTGWMTDAPFNSWYGVTADSSGRVTEVDLSSNNLNGTIPPAIGQLSDIEKLWLKENNLTGIIPPELGQLSILKELSLSQNDLSGTIPPGLGQLSNLTALGLRENNLSGSIPPEIGQLANLEVLQLYTNNLSGTIPSELGQLARLQQLVLSDNQRNGVIPPELGQLASLQELVLSGNQLNGVIPPGLGQLASLQELWLNDNMLSGIIPPELGWLANLQNLMLHTNNLNGTIPTELGELANLIGLGLSENNLSGAIPPELEQLANLEGLWLGGNNLSMAIPPELGQLANLEGLWLDGNNLSMAIPPELGQLANLIALILHENNLSGIIPSELGQLSNLIGLALQENNLSGTIPPELGQLANLEILGLSGNNLSGTIPSELGQLANLEIIELYNDNLNGCNIPPSLWDVPDHDLEIVSSQGCIPTPTPTPTPVPGSRQLPLPFGNSVEVRNGEDDHWEITVLNIVPNATEVVIAESDYNDPPASGNQYYMVRVRVKYLGLGSARFDGEDRLKAVGDGGVAYTNRDDPCGSSLNRIPDPLPDPELFTNGTIEGNVCWKIASFDAASLLMFLEGPGYRPDSSERVWFTLSGGTLLGRDLNTQTVIIQPYSPRPAAMAITCSPRMDILKAQAVIVRGYRASTVSVLPISGGTPRSAGCHRGTTWRLVTTAQFRSGIESLMLVRGPETDFRSVQVAQLGRDLATRFPFSDSAGSRLSRIAQTKDGISPLSHMFRSDRHSQRCPGCSRTAVRRSGC